MNWKKTVCAAALGLGLTLSAGFAQSATLSFEDDDIDFVLRPTTGGGFTIVTSGTLSQGDILVSALEVPIFTINGANAIPTGQELTGISAIQVATTNGTNLTFQPYTGGLNSILSFAGTSVTVAGGDAGGGAVLALYLNSTSGAGGDINLDLNRSTTGTNGQVGGTNCQTFATCITQATLGTLFEVDALGLDADSFWFANSLVGAGGSDIAGVHNAANDFLIAGANFATTATFLNPAYGTVSGVTANPAAPRQPCIATAAADNCIAGLVGSATITGGSGLTNGAIAHSDFDAIKLTTAVPEPATLALVGLGLLGVALGRRRRDA